jgi:uncharacterized protein DUF2066
MRNLKFTILATFLMGLLFVPQALAGPYEVSGIEVEAAAENAVIAKETAIAEGRVRAVRLMMQRITATQDHANLPEIPPEELELMINGFSVDREQAGQTSYSATLTYHFVRQAVQDALLRVNIPFSDREAAPTLLIPIYQQGEQFFLFENNPHLEVWRALRPENQLTPFILPKGDESDMAIDPNALLARDIDTMSGLRFRYQIQNILIALCVTDANMSRFDCELDGGGPTGPITLRQSYTGDDPAAVMTAAALAFVADLEDQWKSGNLTSVPGSQAGEPVQAAVSFGGLREWQQLRARLVSLPEVSEVEVKALNPRGAILVLYVTGGVGALAGALSPFGYELAYAGGTWVIRPF